MKIVLISGYIGSGKTTFANYLKDYLNKKGCYTEKLAFADKVKQIAKEDFLWDGKKDKKGRRLLQVIGTEAGREYDPDIWVKYMLKAIRDLPIDPSVVVIDDWRFPNEYYSLASYYDVYTVRVLGKERISDHPSETSLDNSDIPYFMQIPNTFTSPEEDFDAPAEKLYEILCDYWANLDKEVE